MKIALITDTHYGARKGSKLFHDYFQKFYENVFFPTLEERKITKAIHLGDAFDNRKSVDFWALDWAKENVYDKFKNLGIEVYNIVGNHDAYYKNTNEVNALDSLLTEYDNVVRISEPTEVNILGFKCVLLPWICQDNYDQTIDLIKKTKAKYVFGHLELSGFSVYPGHIQPGGMDPKIFDSFSMVFSGHYHTRSNDGKVFYLGNPYQLYWNDVNDKRGFHIFDTETYELEFIENPYSMFEKVYYEDTNYKLYNSAPLKDKIVKVIVRKKTKQLDFEKFLDKITKSGCSDLKVVENFAICDDDVEFTQEDGEDTFTILNKYIEDSDFDLDKNLVKKIIKEVYQEACELE